MGLNRGSVVLVKAPKGDFEGWVFKDNYEQDGKFEGKTITIKTKKEKLTFNWSEIFKVILQWDASDKSYNNTDYVGDEIEGGGTEKTYDNRDYRSKGEEKKALDKLRELIKVTQAEWYKQGVYGVQLLAAMGLGGAGLAYNFAYTPRGYDWVNLGVLPWAWVVYKYIEVQEETNTLKDFEWQLLDLKEMLERRGYGS